jgi:polar amino acid transport system substrate-binding protein
MVAIVGLLAMLPLTASAGTLDHIRQAGKITFGFREDARPFSYKDATGAAAGYSIALCQKVAEQVKAELGLPALTTEWVPVKLEDRFNAVKDGKVDLLCGADTATLTRRKDVDFSIPILASGIGAVVRADSPAQLQEVLTTGQPSPRPIWRGSPARTVLEQQTFSVVKGTTTERWLAGKLNDFQLASTTAPVTSYDVGIQQVLDRTSAVFFGDRPILLDAVSRNPSSGDLIVLDRLFTNEPAALTLARNDDDFRLIVDHSLSQLFRSPEIRALYTKYFGEPDDAAISFFRMSAVPD